MHTISNQMGPVSGHQGEPQGRQTCCPGSQRKTNLFSRFSKEDKPVLQVLKGRQTCCPGSQRKTHLFSRFSKEDTPVVQVLKGRHTCCPGSQRKTHLFSRFSKEDTPVLQVLKGRQTCSPGSQSRCSSGSWRADCGGSGGRQAVARPWCRGK